MLRSKQVISLITFLALFSTQIYSQWTQLNSGVTVQLYSIKFFDQNTGIAAGNNGTILRTVNGGTSWTSVSTPDSTLGYRGIFFTNSNTGYIAGRILILIPALIAKPVIMKTTDKGASWNSVINDSGFTLYSITFLNDNTGFATGGLFSQGDNKLVKTTDGGNSWNDTTLGSGYLRSADFTNPATGYLSSGSGDIIKTIDGGLNWNVSSHFQDHVIASLMFMDNNTGFAVGGNISSGDSTGKIFRTIDGGNNWDTAYTDHKGSINNLQFVNAATGYAIGTLESSQPLIVSGRILKTVNSGSSWVIDTLFSSISGLTSLYFTDQNTGYITGSNGVILKTTSGGNPIGIEPISTELPDRFNLEQNYPNPFNPETKIKFAIPRSAFTSIKIYDVMGREVALIVNENLKAGIYSVNWSAANYPSGVYFYRIISQDYTDTKKMILLK